MNKFCTSNLFCINKMSQIVFASLLGINTVFSCKRFTTTKAELKTTQGIPPCTKLHRHGHMLCLMSKNLQVGHSVIFPFPSARRFSYEHCVFPTFSMSHGTVDGEALTNHTPMGMCIICLHFLSG